MGMDLFASIAMGFQIAMHPGNLLFCFLGVLIGTLVGVLPGLGPVAAISILLPITFHSTPVSSIILLAGIFYGAMYGGSITSILVNIPGEAASVITCLDGYQMARKGRAGPALGISAFGSFIAGTISVIGLMFIAPPLAEFALKFGPPEYFSLMILSLTILTFMASGSMSKALLTAAFGLFLGSVGLDMITGTKRFTFNIVALFDGVGIVPAIMGLFGIAEILVNVEESTEKSIFQTKIKNLLPTFRDWAQSIGPIVRGTAIGFFLGILPGQAPITSTFVSYAVEKKLSRNPKQFGTGRIEGVAGPESANNATTGASFIPLLTLGIPANAVMSILLGALMIHGINPGPMLIKQHPDLFWGVVTSMYIGNAMLLLLNLPLLGLWVSLLRVPYPILFPLIIVFCVIGTYTMNNNISDVLIMMVFGAIGYLFRKFEYEAAPLVLALVLEPMMEQAFRRSLLLSSGDLGIFMTRPISAVLLFISLILLILPVIGLVRRNRKAVPEEANKDQSSNPTCD
jgi:putative tricarboxylic transport membrane protein